MARRSEHSLEEIRAMVLNAAEAIVIKEGYSALKMRRIAKEIGYTVGSIYMVFTNMADLIMHIKARTLDGIAAQLQQVQDCAPEQCIAELARIYLRYASQNFNRWSMIFEYRLPQDAEIPEWYQEKADNVFSRVEAQFAKLAPQCSAQQSKQAARALWSGVHGICILSLTGKPDVIGIKDVENAIVLLVESFIGGWVGSLLSGNQQ
jgi:AcrR family transcriptional regulator